MYTCTLLYSMNTNGANFFTKKGENGTNLGRAENNKGGSEVHGKGRSWQPDAIVETATTLRILQ